MSVNWLACAFVIMLCHPLAACGTHSTADEPIDEVTDPDDAPDEDDFAAMVDFIADEDGEVIGKIKVPQTTVDRVEIELVCWIKYDSSTWPDLRNETRQGLVIGVLVDAAKLIVPTRTVDQMETGIDGALLNKMRDLVPVSPSPVTQKIEILRLACFLGQR